MGTYRGLRCHTAHWANGTTFRVPSTDVATGRTIRRIAGPAHSPIVELYVIILMLARNDEDERELARETVRRCVVDWGSQTILVNGCAANFYAGVVFQKDCGI